MWKNVMTIGESGSCGARFDQHDVSGVTVDRRHPVREPESQRYPGAARNARKTTRHARAIKRALIAFLAVSVIALLVAQIASASPYSAAVAADSPFAWWRLDEASGLTAANSGSAGSALNGTYANASYGQTGIDVTDAAAGFNGTNTQVTATSSLLEPTGAFSVEAWFRTSPPPSGNEFVFRTNAAYGLWLLVDGVSGNFGKAVFGFYDNGARGFSATSASRVDDGLWHQVVGTYSGGSTGTLQLFIDGHLSASSTYIAPVYYGGATGIAIGQWSNKSFFAGAVDEFAFYNGVLSAARVAAHYNAADLLGALPVATTYGGANGSMPGLTKCQCEADPVNTENGDFFETSTDASVATYGPPLTFTRTYDALLAQSQSASGAPESLGYGWTDNWDLSASVSSGTVTITQANGAQVVFKTPTSGSCTAPYVGSGAAGTYCALPAVTASLAYNSTTSTYTFITHPYRKYTFNASGQLASESQPGGATLSISRATPAPGSGACPSTATSCNTITSASGRKLVIAMNSVGRITRVTDPLGHSWIYAYCAPPSSTCSAGDLVSVTDPLSRVTSFSYDAANPNTNLVHDLLSITRPNGQSGGSHAGSKLVNAYNSSGQVTTQTDPAGNQTTFDYTHLASATATGYTVETDPDGNKTQFSYNGGLLTSRTEAYTTASAATWTYVSDPRTALTLAETDPNGHETDYTYDSAGNVATVTDPLGSKVTHSYNSFDEPVCDTAPLATSGCASLSPPAAITAGTATITPPSSAPPKFATYSEYDTNGDLIYTTTGDYAPGGRAPVSHAPLTSSTPANRSRWGRLPTHAEPHRPPGRSPASRSTRTKS